MISIFSSICPRWSTFFKNEVRQTKAMTIDLSDGRLRTTLLVGTTEIDQNHHEILNDKQWPLSNSNISQ